MYINGGSRRTQDDICVLVADGYDWRRTHKILSRAVVVSSGGFGS